MSSYVALAAALAGAALPGCTLDKTPRADGQPRDLPDGMDGSVDGAGPDAQVDGGPPPSLLDGERAERLATLTLDQPIARVERAGEHVVALLETSGLALLDVGDARMPRGASLMATVGRAVAVHYDHDRQVLFVLTASGDLRAFRLTNPSAPARVGAAQIAAPGGDGDDATFVDFTRVGQRLYLLAPGHLVPVDAVFGDDGGVAFEALPSVELEAGAQRIAPSGAGLYVAFEGGALRTYTAVAAPARVGEVTLGAALLGWAVRGQRLFVALERLGLRALGLRPGAQADVLLRASELDDATLLAREGQAVAVALARGVIAVLDVSDARSPRGIAVYEPEDDRAPSWIALAGGNLLLGSGRRVDVVGVPPFVEAGVPETARGALPLHGRVPLRFSKPLDPGSITVEAVTMRCDGRLVPSQPLLDLERRTVTLLPEAELERGASCELRLRGVRDPLGLTATARARLLTFTASTREDVAIQNGPSAAPHTAEGRMTGWSAGASEDFEYFDIEPAKGLTAELYADYDGERLWLLFDAIEHRDALYRDCGAVFSGFTASSRRRFTARVIADQRVIAEGADVIGGYAYGATRGSREPHAAFELAIETEPGGFAIQAYLPSLGRGCEISEREPVVWSGMCDETGCTVSGSSGVDAPVMPRNLRPSETTDETPVLRFEVPNDRMSLPASRVELRTQGELPETVYRATTYSSSLAVPPGVLGQGKRYDVRVTTHNVAGTARALTGELTIAMACAHSECLPGGALAASCSTCAAAVCEEAPGCCARDASYGGACVEAASARCDCNAPTLTALTPDTGRVGEPLTVAVTLADSTASLSHALVLTPEGGGDETELTCAFEAGAQATCRAALPLDLAAGRYAAAVRIRAGDAAYATAPLEGALTLTP